MHYKDGTEAKLFDTVKGKFYLTDRDGKSSYQEREGVIVALTPGYTSCNGQVLVGDSKNRGCLSICEHDGSWTQGQILEGQFLTATLCELELVPRIPQGAFWAFPNEKVAPPIGHGG